MEDKYKYSTSQLFNFAKDSYLERTSRPIYAIVFLLPFIIFYELGTILINADVLSHYWQGRVVAFSWLQRFLELLGFGSKFAWVAPPLAVVVVLASLQVASRKRWRFWLVDIVPMTLECILLAVPLIVLGLLLNNSAEQRDNVSQFGSGATYTICYVQHDKAAPVCSSVTGNALSVAPEDSSNNSSNDKSTSLLANVVTSIGAGIYEELVFRLILICVLMIVFQNVLRLSHKSSVVFAVLASAALFSAYHHIDFFSGQLYQTDLFDLTRFIFRTIAGIYFAILFAIRGFGITAGTHAFYDIIAVSMNAIFSHQ